MACPEALQCPSCLDVFKDPVMLPCSHSFCRSCVERWWEGKKDRSCPLCRTECRSMDLPLNLALRNVCEAFAASSVDTEEECKLHKEKLKLFCLDHQQPVCLVCRHANIHTNHKFSPIEEAAKEHREDLQKVLQVMTKRLKMFTKVKEDISQQAEHIQVQKQQAESKIKETFKKLHNFLEKEEEARLSAVREEEQSKNQTMKEKIEGLSSDMKALQGVIISTEKLLTADNVSFLKNYKEMRARAQKLPKEPKLVLGPVLDMDKYLDNIPLTWWEKNKTLVSQSAVIPNPNTSNPELRQKLSREEQHPKNPVSVQDLHVLNVTAVHPEAHTWNVDVGHNDKWELGFMFQSFRAGIRFQDRKYKRIYPLREDLPLSIKEKQQRFRVRFDISKGKFSFHDFCTDTILDTFDVPISFGFWKYLSRTVTITLYTYISKDVNTCA
ncbi:tripartite motif-containing protein 12A-like [Entelurus aequoreus]|uniref:tripartite motif-containing protein 12A-like n=1 Tax=Entelurus aequoreus TaxID=161455 RepID=UPI002B1D69FA|nr:tripartite motif-containing protein 12A-like [Entelurus aequoreus]